MIARNFYRDRTQVTYPACKMVSLVLQSLKLETPSSRLDMYTQSSILSTILKGAR